MKILHIVKYYHPSKGGTETFVRQLAEGLNRRSIKSTVLTFKHNSELNSFDIIDSIPVHRIESPWKIASQPISLNLSSKIEELIASHDIVHINSPFPNVECLVRKYKRKPICVTWHAEPFLTRWRKLYFLYKPFLTNFLKETKKIAITSPNMLQNSVSLKKFENKCVVIPLSYRQNREGIRTKAKDLHDGIKKILYIGALRPYKGISYLVSAIRNIENCQLLIIGDGEERDHLKRLTVKLKLEEKINFHHNASDEEVVNYYNNSDIFVLPSVGSGEAFGIVQLEAMSFALPVINTNLPTGVPFVSLNGVTGITVPVKDERAIATAINKIFNDPSLYNFFSINALNRVKEFSEDRMVSAYIRLYNDCVV